MKRRRGGPVRAARRARPKPSAHNRKARPPLKAEIAAVRAALPQVAEALPESSRTRAMRYLELLLTARRDQNLVGFQQPDQLIAECVLDGWSLSQTLEPGDLLLDIGSGAGLPGIGLALGWPERRIVLLEPRRLRATFLREVAEAIGHGGLQVEQGRLQSWDRAAVEGAVLFSARAVASVETLVGWLEGIARPGDRLFVAGAAPLEAAPVGTGQRVVRYHVAGVERAGLLVTFEPLDGEGD